jgi:cell division protein FtsZ
MIEFTADGPFSEKADQLFPGRVRIIGLGQTGAAVCDQLVLHGRPGQDLWVFDSDQLSIEGSVVPNRHLLGRPLVHGLGCSGDVELAREIVALEEARLGPVARGCDFLILALGLAGATGVALAERLIELGHEAGAKVIVIGVQPFGFEGIARRERAVAAIAGLRREADSVLVLAHDRIADNPATVKNIRHGFHLMHQLMSGMTQALSQIVCKRGLIQLSFADVRALYGRYAGSEVLENCWAAHVEGDIHDRTEDLVTTLLQSPLLADESIWKRVDHAIVAVSGTRDLGLSDVQEMVSALKDRMPGDIPIATSASLDEELHDKVRITVLLATTAPARMSVPEIVATLESPKPAKKARPVAETKRLPAAAKPKPQPEPVALEPEPEPIAEPVIVQTAPKKPKVAPKPIAPPEPVVVENLTIPEEELIPVATTLELEPPLAAAPTKTQPERTSRRFHAKQEEMSFEGPPRGRFEKTHETMYRGENLDQPTYRRRGLKIRV